MRHIQFWWLYQAEYTPDRLFHRLTGCLWGRHRWSEVWKRDGTLTALYCYWCEITAKEVPMPTPKGFGTRGAQFARCRTCQAYIVRIDRKPWEHALPSWKTQGHEAVPAEEK